MGSMLGVIRLLSKALERRRAALGPSAASARMAPVPAPTILVQRLRGVGNARLHQDQSATDYEGKPMWDPRLAMHCLMPADCAVAITGAAHKGDLSGLTGVPLAAELPARAAGLTDRAQMLASALAREQQKRTALEQSEAELRGVGHDTAAAALRPQVDAAKAAEDSVAQQARAAEIDASAVRTQLATQLAAGAAEAGHDSSALIVERLTSEWQKEGSNAPPKPLPPHDASGERAPARRRMSPPPPKLSSGTWGVAVECEGRESGSQRAARKAVERRDRDLRDARMHPARRRAGEQINHSLVLPRCGGSFTLVPTLVAACAGGDREEGGWDDAVGGSQGEWLRSLRVNRARRLGGAGGEGGGVEGSDGDKEWAEWVGGLVDKGAMIHSSVLLATLEETRQELTQIEQRAAALAVEMPAARGECAALAASIASERVAVLETEHAQPLLRQGAVAHLDVSMGDCDGGVARPGEDREGVHVARGPARATRQQLREWKQAKARMESELEEMEEEGTRLRQREALLRRTLQVLDATPALTIACLHNQPQVVKTLLERGASACARSSDGAEGGSVFDAALAPGRQACVAQLCAHMRPADVARLLSIDPSPASEEPSEGARADTLQAVGGVGEPVEAEAGIPQGPPMAAPVSSMDACEVSGAASSDDADRSEEVRELLQYDYRKLVPARTEEKVVRSRSGREHRSVRTVLEGARHVPLPRGQRVGTCPQRLGVPPGEVCEPEARRSIALALRRWRCGHDNGDAGDAGSAAAQDG